MKNSTIVVAGAAILLLVGVMFYMSSAPKTGVAAPLDGFAQCLQSKGVKFFGAFWCPHCQAQKRLFGSSVSKLPYIECSTPDGNGQTAICKENGIQSYPTWVYADGSTSTGEQSLDTLAGKSGCVLPQDGAQTAPLVTATTAAQSSAKMGPSSTATVPVGAM
jgi:thiol-disulfide isomerase/thioredoxin